MFVHTTPLRYWKSERADITTCEDALRENSECGLFAVADGAGTTLFSNIWADILVEHFITVPLLSDDVFEMEWWVREAHPRYTQEVPPIEKLAWNAQEKARKQGAFSTLATLRASHVSLQSVEAELLVIGDSCVITGRPKTETVGAFPLQEASEFDRAPFCVPALLRNLNRNGLNCRRLSYTLFPDDIVILATDAVSRWIVSGADGRLSQWQAFKEVADQTESSWSTFIAGCRERREMVDDDVTALILRLQEQPGTDAVPLGATTDHTSAVLEKRREAFAQAEKTDNKELIAILYGDGKDIADTAGVRPLPEKIEKARAVADALKEVMQALRDGLNNSNVARTVNPVWERYAPLLEKEPCAENLRKSLVANGVRMRPEQAGQPAPKHEASPIAPAVGLPSKPPATTLPPHVPTNLTFIENGGVTREVGLSTPLSPEDMDKTIRVNALNTPQQMGQALYQGQALIAGRHQALLKFRVALESKNDALIVKSYDPILDDSPDVTPAERTRLDSARRNTVSDEKELFVLRNRLVEAYRNDNDDEFLAVVREIKNSPYADNIQFTPRELERIRVAEQRKAAYSHLVEVLREGTAPQKAEAAALIPDSHDHAILNLEGKEQIALARRLVDAYKNGDNKAICAAYAEIEFSAYRKYFLFTNEEQRRIRAAQKGQETIGRFRTILRSGYASAQLLIDTYSLIPQSINDLTEDEHYQVALADRFLQAYHDKKDALISKLHDVNHYSPYPFVITEYEAERIGSVQEKAVFVPSVVKVKEESVKIGEFIALLHVKKLFLRYQFNILKTEPATAEWHRKKQILEQQQLPQYFVPGLLDDLVDHTLIQYRLKNMRQRSSIEKETRDRARQKQRDLRNSMKNGYNKLLESVNDDEAYNALYILTLREIFETSYLQRLDQPVTLRDWLSSQRETMPAFYVEHAEDEAQSTHDQKRCWVFRWKSIRDMYNTASEEQSDQGGQSNA